TVRLNWTIPTSSTGANEQVAGSPAGEAAAIANEMGLVIVAGVERRRGEGGRGGGAGDCPLEPTKKREALRSHSDPSQESAFELTLARAQRARHRRHRGLVMGSVELLEGARYQWIAGERELHEEALDHRHA